MLAAKLRTAAVSIGRRQEGQRKIFVNRLSRHLFPGPDYLGLGGGVSRSIERGTLGAGIRRASIVTCPCSGQLNVTARPNSVDPISVTFSAQ
jgi:hypothetical protein